jgi:NADPH:quinone reductase-like Zn-dependent oxidoreductase
MRAVTFPDFGAPIQTIEVPDPVPGDGQVLVAVQAASINPVDVAVHNGPGRTPDGATPPYRLGWDLAGHITAVGAGVDAAPIGSYVLGFSSWFAAGNGTQAALAVLDAEGFAVAPETVAPAELTTLGLNALTALQAVRAADVAGSTVIVTGASGGVGGHVVEFAARAGATVWAMASDAATVTGFGAARVLPRSAADAIAALGDERADIVIDTASLGTGILPAVRDGGRVVTVTQPVESERGVEVKRVGVRANAADLAEIVALAASGGLAMRVEKTFPADEAASAYDYFSAGSHTGRVVLLF